MGKNKQRGKVVYNEFFKREDYVSAGLFEKAVKERVKYLKMAKEVYTNGQLGSVKVFRNRIGARVIAYDLAEESKWPLRFSYFKA